jgi:uncharacterized DUF497 family protein
MKRSTAPPGLRGLAFTVLFVPEIAYIANMETQFEWDPGKAESNLLKHEVSFAEAATVFFDPLSITIPDPWHSFAERRLVVTGLSYKQRHLVVVHSDHGDRSSAHG